MKAVAISKGLGWFSIGLGLVEILRAKSLAQGLGAGRRGEKILKGYGGREIAAGLSLLQAPAHAPRMWNRVVGDALDAATLAPLLRGRNAKRKAAVGALLFVGGAALIDVLVARALSKTPDPSLGKVAAAA